MPVIRARVLGATQFNPSTSGLFEFAPFSGLYRSTGIVIGLVGYFEGTTGPPLTTDVEVWAQLAGGDPEDRVPIGSALSSVGLLNLITGNADMRLCGIELPREPGDDGQFWDVLVATKNKTQNAVVTVQYRITPGPETSTHDSTE